MDGREEEENKGPHRNSKEEEQLFLLLVKGNAKKMLTCKKPYCRSTAMTHRNSSDCPNVPMIPLPWRVRPSEALTGSWTFHGKVGGIVEERCGAFASRNIFLNTHAASS